MNKDSSGGISPPDFPNTDRSTEYKCQTNGVSVTIANGSKLPLVPEITKDVEKASYNPFHHRSVRHPTTNFETLVHLLKGSLGTGILSMPLAFYNSGLIFGLFATFIIVCICTYCIHILINCSRILCKRMKVPSLGFADVAEVAFLSGRPSVKKFSSLARGMVDLFLILDLLGCCCVYVVFVASNLEQVFRWYDFKYNVRWYMVALLPPLILLNLIRNLKFLAPFSMVANVLTGAAMTITFYFIFNDLPSIDERPMMAEFNQLPLFFGTAIFALEGIGVVMPLENNMKTPQDFTGCFGVLNMGMCVVVVLYSAFGFFGYLRWSQPQGSITLNLPQDSILGQAVKVMIAFAIFITYSLQFYVPIEISWKMIRHRFSSHPVAAENTLRITLVILTVVAAVIVPNLGPFISLIGALCLSMLGLIFPSVIELVTYIDEPGYGPCYWMIWKNLAIIAFGILGFVTGTYSSIYDIVKNWDKL